MKALLPPTASSSSSSSSSLHFYFKKVRLSPFLLTLVLFLFLFSLLYGEDLKELLGQQGPLSQSNNNNDQLRQSSVLLSEVSKKGKKWQGKLPFAVYDDEDEECDIFAGRWVRDEETHPLYQESDCPYIQPQLTCQARGRPDKGYQFWRWQPFDCTLPSFNATLMLETLRNKRMMFVGDSLNRGQFTSMVCLLQSVIPNESKSFVQSPDQQHTVFTAKDYNATVEFYWAPFLLHSNSDNAIVHRISDRMVRKGSINHHGQHWKGVHIMVFNTYLWWCTGLRFRILHGSFEDEVKETTWVSTEDAYGMAFRDMLQWVRDNMNPNNTRVFFTSMSPTHEKSGEWGGKAGNNCYNETRMVEDNGYWGSGSRKKVMRVIREILDEEADVPITFLNITQLSMYRKDAHTSIYKKQWNQPSPEQLADPKSYADCVHWCLPGLQDTWNELLYTKLFYPN